MAVIPRSQDAAYCHERAISHHMLKMFVVNGSNPRLYKLLATSTGLAESKGRDEAANVSGRRGDEEAELAKTCVKANLAPQSM